MFYSFGEAVLAIQSDPQDKRHVSTLELSSLDGILT